MKLLMITSRNIDQKGGENALIVGRHSYLYHEFGVKTDVVFYHKDSTLTESLGDGMKFIPSKVADIFDTVSSLIQSGEYQGLVISGFYNSKFNNHLLKLKKANPFVIILDIHATIREIYEYCIPDLYHYLGTRYLYIKKKHVFSKTLKIADYAFVVTDESIKETNSFCKKNHIEYIKVRCGCKEPVNISQYFEDRKATREELGIGNDTLAFVYSGSKDGWQKYAETVALFEKVAANNQKCKFAFYMNLNDSDKEELYHRLGEKNVIVRWVKPEQMLRELSGYDVGMLLRDPKWTNTVAFPNKFSDYIHSNLALVMTDAIREPYRIAQTYNLDILTEDDLSERGFCDQYLEKRANTLSEYVVLCQKVVDHELLYSEQVSSQCCTLVETLKKIACGGNDD